MYLAHTFTYNNNQYVCNNVILGQGHHGSDNNWWIFTNTNHEKGAAYGAGYVILACTNTATNNTEYLYVKSAGNYAFSFAGASDS